MSFRQSRSFWLWSVIFCFFLNSLSAEEASSALDAAQTDAGSAALAVDSSPEPNPEPNPEPKLSILPTLYSAITPAFSTQPEFSTAQVTVIDASQFGASALSVADVIERAPSVQLQQTGATGSYASVSVRGAPSAQTQIYVDGVLQSNVGGEGGFLQQMSLADVERIEVYSGSTPTQFAQGSPGGAINIVRRTARENRTKVLVETGSFGQRRGLVASDFLVGNLALTAFVEGLAVDNNFTYLNDGGTPQYADDDLWQRRNNAQFEAWSGALTGTVNQAKSSYFISLSAHDQQKNLPHWANLSSADSYYQQGQQSLQLGLNLADSIWHQDSSLRLNISEDLGHFSDPANGLGSFVSDSRDRLLSRQLAHTSVLPLAWGLLTLNNQLDQAHFVIAQQGVKQVDAERLSGAHSLGADWFVGAHTTLTGSLRYATYRDSSGATESADSRLSGQAGIGYQRGEHRVQANLQSSERLPNLIERFGNLGSFKGNADLAAENALSGDLNYQWAGSAYQFNATVFARQSNNTIAPVYNSQGIGRYINIDQSRFYGLEWQVDVPVGALDLSSSGSWQRGWASSPLKVYDEKQVPGFYPLSARQEVSWTPLPGLTWQGSYRYQAGLYFDRANSTMATAKHQFNSALSGRKNHWQAPLDVENLLNRYQVDYSNSPLPGRKILVTLVYFFGENR
jgi:outer membrane cobalamin receptor